MKNQLLLNKIDQKIIYVFAESILILSTTYISMLFLLHRIS